MRELYTINSKYNLRQKVIDAIFAPFRLLFLPEKGKFGLSSLQEERMKEVFVFCKGKVLDIGCGSNNRFITEYIGTENGVGIDVFPYNGVENIIADMTHLPFTDSSFDTVTLIAVGGHIPKSKRKAEFEEFARILKPGGLLIMTEGEPITQFFIHKWRYLLFLLGLGECDDMKRGMKEDEEFCMNKDELLSHLQTPPMKFLFRKRFMWNFNNIYVAEKRDV